MTNVMCLTCKNAAIVMTGGTTEGRAEAEELNHARRSTAKVWPTTLY